MVYVGIGLQLWRHMESRRLISTLHPGRVLTFLLCCTAVLDSETPLSVKRSRSE
jgi:hypothetical protein